MPIKKIEPDVAFTVFMKGRSVCKRFPYEVFHAYEDDQWDKPCDFVYSTDILERRDFDFDIRDVETALREALGDTEMRSILPYALLTYRVSKMNLGRFSLMMKLKTDGHAV